MTSVIFPCSCPMCPSRLALFLVASTFLGGGASAADVSVKTSQPSDNYYSADDFWTRQYLLGDLGRTRLKQEGVSFSGEIKNEYVANLSGGEKNASANAGQLVFEATFDAEKLIGLHGALLGMKLVDRWGRNLNDDAGIPGLQLTDEVFGRDKIVRLFEFYYDQKFFNGLLEVKGGRLPVGSDFFFDNCDFLNLTFCGGQPGNILGGYIYNFPVSQMGGVVKLNLPNTVQFEVGFYDSNTNYLGTKPSVALLPTFAPSAPNSGLLAPAELNWKGSINGLAATWRIGAWYDSQKAEQAVAAAGIAGATPIFERGEYGGYASIWQQLQSPAGVKDAEDREHGVFTFLNLTLGDHRTSVQDYQIAWGLQKVGTFSSRPEDQIGFAVGTTHINSSIASAEAATIPHLGVQHNEYPLEAWYGWQATPWLNLRFDLQYVINPGGFDDGNDLSAHRNTTVVGLRTVLKL